MEFQRRLRANWLTRKPRDSAETVTTALSVLIAVATWMAWNGVAGADAWMPSSGEAVFGRHEYWRLWTSLLVHGDLGHLVANAVLFVPLSYFLAGYFGFLLFPALAFLFGGLTNYVALSGLNPQTQLVGVSGVVYWMGAVWLTLYLLLERRESIRRRSGKVLFIAAALFLPQTFEPNVSYISHLYGFLFGLPSALIYYAAKRHAFHAAEVWEDVFEADPIATESVFFEKLAGEDSSLSEGVSNVSNVLPLRRTSHD